VADAVASDIDLRRVQPGDLATSAARFIGLGARFEMLVGLDERSIGGDGLAVEVVLSGSRDTTRLRADMPLDEPSYPSVSRQVPAAIWDEREVKDLFGIVAVGLPDPRRLVLHERWPAGYHPLRKDVPADVPPPAGDRHYVPFEVQGEGVYQLPVGPIHAGVIEPGHFRFSAIGERVLHLDPRLFFTHRGLEKLVEGRSFEAALPIVERACGVCTVTHGLAYSQAVEALTQTTVPDRARWGRVILGELERLYNHVGDLGNVCAGVGFQSGVARLGILKERLLQLNEGVTGHRYLMGVVGPGGLRIELDAAGLGALAAALPPFDHELGRAVRAVIRSEGVVARLRGTGLVDPTLARTLGATGVAAKASGIPDDLRRDRRMRRIPSSRLVRPWRRQATSRPGSTCAPRKPMRRFVCSSRPWSASGLDRVDPHWLLLRGRATPRSAPSKGHAVYLGSGCVPAQTRRWTACTCDRPRSPTGPWWPQQCPATSWPTSR